MKKSSGSSRLQSVTTRISFDGLFPPDIETIPSEVRIFINEAIEGVFEQQAMFEHFRNYISRYPRIPILQSSYSSELYDYGHTEEALAVAEQCYHTFKHYPFGRLRYAHLLCNEERYAEMGEVMEKFRKQLPHLYPKRILFDYVEVAMFMYLAACYYYSISEPQQGDIHARIYMNIMEQAEDYTLARYGMQESIAATKAKFAGTTDTPSAPPAEESQL